MLATSAASERPCPLGTDRRVSPRRPGPKPWHRPWPGLRRSDARDSRAVGERRRLASRAVQTLRRTPLYDRHVAPGARLVPFAGWEMPVQYEGVIAEHRAVRTDAGVFDVSHMGEIEVEGPTAQRAAPGDALERRRPARAGRRAVHAADERATAAIIDDLIVYRLERAPLPARRQRVEPRGRLRVAGGARAARLRRARRLRRLRAARRAGPARARAARPAARRRRSRGRWASSTASR